MTDSFKKKRKEKKNKKGKEKHIKIQLYNEQVFSYTLIGHFITNCREVFGTLFPFVNIKTIIQIKAYSHGL